MTKSNQHELAWKMQYVSANLKERMNAAVDQLSAVAGEEYRLITHLFGRVFICSIKDLIIFTAGSRGRPATIVTVAIATKEPDLNYFIGIRNEDVDACCKHLGWINSDEREALVAFAEGKKRGQVHY